MASFFVGIDVGKLKHQVAIIDVQGAACGKALSVRSSADGFGRLAARLTELGPPEIFLVGMEATGPYGWPLHHFLSARGYTTHVLNPLQCDAFARMRIRKTKTDPIDAAGLAQLLRFGKFSPAIVPHESAMRLRELTRYRARLVFLLGRLTNLLGSRLQLVFPELPGVLGSITLSSALSLLRRYPLPRDLAAVSEEHLAAHMHAWSYGRWGAAKARAVLEAARSTVGLPLIPDAFALQIRGVAGIVRVLEAHIRKVSDQVADRVRQMPQVLTSVPGIGETSAGAILGEIVDIKLFDRPEKLVAFAGFDPSTWQTGQSDQHGGAISKRGSPFLRRAIWSAGFTAARFCPELKAYYDRKRLQGKNHKTALAATCGKLIHLIWRLMTDNRPYAQRLVGPPPPPAR